MNDRRATMAEVAAAAGVSVPTVSKVVNGRPDVSPSTRRRVEEVLRVRNYSPPRARTRDRVGLIDLVFIDLGSPWAMEILAGVEEVAHRADTGVVVSAVHGRKRTRPDRRWLEQLAPFDPSPARYKHNLTGEDNGDAHHKRQIMGREVVVAVTAGKLDFGPWEQIFYGEFDGRRPKRVLVKIIGE